MDIIYATDLDIEMMEYCDQLRRDFDIPHTRLKTFEGYWDATGFLTSQLQLSFDITEPDAYRFVDAYLSKYYEPMLENEINKKREPWMYCRELLYIHTPRGVHHKY